MNSKQGKREGVVCDRGGLQPDAFFGLQVDGPNLVPRAFSLAWEEKAPGTRLLVAVTWGANKGQFKYGK